MSAYILCQTRRTQRPFYVESIGINIYSGEELCYFMWNNLPLLDESLLNQTLVEWINDELHLPSLAQKLIVLFEKEYTISDFVMPVFREVHYLTGPELKKLEQRLGLIESQPRAVSLKTKGDILFSNRRYAAAIASYKKALEAGDADEAVGVQLMAMILNNMGCVYARLFQLEEACACFKSAYDVLHSGAALKSYLLSLCLKDGEDAFREAAEELKVDAETLSAIEKEIGAFEVPDMPEDIDAAIDRWVEDYHNSTAQ